MSYAKPTELLADMDSHGIYDAAMLDECEFDTDCVPQFTPERTVRDIERRGLGGQLVAKPASKLIYGWTTAEALATKFLGRDPTPTYISGRGTRFRHCVQALREGGF